MCRLKTSVNKRSLLNKAPQNQMNSKRFCQQELKHLPNPQTGLPAIAKNQGLIAKIEDAIRLVPTQHELLRQDARDLDFLDPGTVHLVLTSPPYWTLKKYRESDGQLGSVENYEQFFRISQRVATLLSMFGPGWAASLRGWRCLLVARKNDGRHTVVPLHASIQEHSRKLGSYN